MKRDICEIAKEEILSREEKPCCKIAFLSGAIRGAGELVFTSLGFALLFRHNEENFIVKVKDIVESLTSEEFVYEKSFVDMGYKRGNMFTLSVPAESAVSLLETCGIVKNKVEFVNTLPASITGKNCCKRAYLRGLFISCGNLSVPEDIDDWRAVKTKAGYSLEFELNSDMVIAPIRKLLANVSQTDINAVHIRPRRNSLYIKRADSVSGALAAMGCDKAVIKLSEIIAARQLKNDLNRANNFDLANIEKSVGASERQLEIIKKVEEKYGLNNIPNGLRETCLMRREYPDLGLEELGKKFDPPISKSCVNHRMRKLAELSRE